MNGVLDYWPNIEAVFAFLSKAKFIFDINFLLSKRRCALELQLKYLQTLIA